MNWLKLSLAGWRLRPLRTGVTAAGVGLAVAAWFSLLSFQAGYRDGMKNELARLGAHILVVPKGCPYDAASIALHGASWPCYLPAAYLDEVCAAPGVTTAAPAFMTALHEGTSTNTVYVGVDEKFLRLRPAWQIRGRFPQATNELLLGAEAAQRRGWQLGQTVPLPGLTNATGLVSGILGPTHGAEDDFIYLRLADAQHLFAHPRQLTHILVRLADSNALDRAVTHLRGCDAGMDMNIVPLAHLFHTIQSLVNSTRLLLGCVAAVALLVAAAGVGNTILMAVAERTREIGVMRALGASRADIFRLFWWETMQVCLVGGVGGLAFAFLASRVLENWLRARLPFAPVDALIRWEWWAAAAGLAGAALVGSIAGFLPAWRAARLSPVLAMRSTGGDA